MQLLRRLAVVTMAAATALAGVITATPAHAAPDIYVTPGTHSVNGRQWKTTCANYSTTIERCTTTIYGTVITNTGGKYVQTNGWMFNNLTYKANPRATWKGNPLAMPGLHTINGREWRVECDTPNVGRNGCRAYIWGTVIGKTGNTYGNITGWQFNNQIRFTDGPTPGSSLYANWVELDVKVDMTGTATEEEMAKLSELPADFQTFMETRWFPTLFFFLPQPGCPDFIPKFQLRRYHGAGYAVGAWEQCQGGARVWPPQSNVILSLRDGKWTYDSKPVYSCSELPEMGLPQGAGMMCS